MNLLKKLRLMLWYFFNKQKVLDYLEIKNTRTIVYNKFAYDAEWSLVVINSRGEILSSETFSDESLADVRLKYEQLIKPLYNELYLGHFDIISLFPDDPRPDGYTKACGIYREKYPTKDDG